MNRRRRRLTADLTGVSYDGWHTYATLHGVNVTALLEAVGDHLVAHGWPPSAPLEEARRIAAARRARPKVRGD